MKGSVVQCGDCRMPRIGPALLAVAVLVFGCSEPSTSPSVGADAFDLPADQVAIGVETEFLNRGVVTSTMVADSAYAFENGRRMELHGVTVTFFTERGAPSGTLTSLTADYDNRLNLFIARGNVVLITEGQNGSRHLESEELHYDINGDQIWTNTEFTLLEEGRTTRGSSFRTDSKFQTWQVTGVQSQGRLPDDAGMRF